MKLIRRIDFDYQPGKVVFSRDGSRFLALGGGQILSHHIDGRKEGSPIETIRVWDAAYLNDEQLVAAIISLERQIAVAIFDIQTGQVIASVNDGDIRSVCVDPNHGRIFAGCLDNDEIIIYDLSLNRSTTFQLPYLHMPGYTIISHSGDRLAVAGVFFGVWDISGDPKLISEECPKGSDCTGTPCEVNSGTITPDGRYAAAGFHGAKGVCAVMDGMSGNILHWYGPRGDEINYYATRALALSPDGQYVVVGLDGTTKFWFYRVSDGTVAFELDPQEYGDIAFSPIGDVFATSGEKAVTLWQFDG